MQTLCPDDVTFQPQLVSRPGSRAALQHHSARGCRDTPVTSSFTVLPTHSGEPAHYERLHAYHRKRDVRTHCQCPFLDLFCVLCCVFCE